MPDAVESGNRLGVAAFEEEYARDLVQHHAILRVLGLYDMQRLQRRVVIAIGLLDESTEIVDAPSDESIARALQMNGLAASVSPS